jgi:hypothetical protein
MKDFGEAAAPTNPIGGRSMAEPKRGKLREVTTKPMYEDGNISGYTVRARHDSDPSAGKNDGMMFDPTPVETPHETLEGATAKHGEHLADNEAKFGKGKGGRKKMPMNDGMMKAMGRKG